MPWLAERWYTTDNKNYTFFLKKGVRFHNGRELKAADVKFVLDRAMNPETKHPYRAQYDGHPATSSSRTTTRSPSRSRRWTPTSC